MEERILSLLASLCADFAPYHFLPSDLYKGRLLHGHNVYYKVGIYGTRGMVTSVRNIRRFGLNKFPTNFEAEGDRSGSRIERGWSEGALLEVLEHLQQYKR